MPNHIPEIALLLEEVEKKYGRKIMEVFPEVETITFIIPIQQPSVGEVGAAGIKRV